MDSPRRNKYCDGDDMWLTVELIMPLYESYPMRPMRQVKGDGLI